MFILFNPKSYKIQMVFRSMADRFQPLGGIKPTELVHFNSNNIDHSLPNF